MSVIFWIIGSVILISALSLIGVVSLAISKNKLHKFLNIFVAFASGSLLTAAFIHLIPEAYHEIEEKSFSFVLFGMIFFFIFEKFIHWHHCGKEECHVRPVAYLNLAADALHNFIDGVIIAAAYLVDIPLGVVTTAAIVLHEIPQEFGDFSVLIHSGMKIQKALLFNFLSAASAIIGAIIGYSYLSSVEYLIPYALSLAAGGFIYIASTDLMPELHKEGNTKNMIKQTIALLLGVILLMTAFNVIPHEQHAEQSHQTKFDVGLPVDNDQFSKEDLNQKKFSSSGR